MNWKEKLLAAIGGAAVALAVPLVQKYEGTVLSSCREPVCIVTPCTGHTGPELKIGQTCTRQQCEEMFY